MTDKKIYTAVEETENLVGSYAQRFEDLCVKHQNAMTAESLNGKAAIARELAMRDLQIEMLVAANEILRMTRQPHDA